MAIVDLKSRQSSKRILTLYLPKGPYAYDIL